MGKLMYKRITIGAAAFATAAGLGIHDALAQDDALDALMRDLGALIQPAPDAVAAPAVEEAAIPAEEAAVPDAPDVADVAAADAVAFDDPVVVDFADDALDIADEPIVIADLLDDDADPVVAGFDAPAARVPAAPALLAPVAAAPALTAEQKAIEDLRQMEKLRIKAVESHAYETLELARATAKKGNYQLAHEQFELASVWLPENDTLAREAARAGSHEALYNQAKLLYRNKLLEEARDKAQLARDKGNPRQGN